MGDAGSGGGAVRGAGGILWKRTLLGERIALVRRTRHARELGEDEWSLPKGHAREGVPLVEEAQREVEEETGWLAAVSAHAGFIEYPTTAEGRKRVDFWHMRALAKRGDPDPEEVVAVAWLRPRAALRRLTHPEQARLLARELCQSPRSTASWRRTIPSLRDSRRERFVQSLAIQRIKLDALEERAGPTLATARRLLDVAEAALGRGDLNGAWDAYFAAQEWEIAAYDEHELRARAHKLREEAVEKLKESWRGAAVQKLLAWVDAKEEEGATKASQEDRVRSLVAATRLHNERYSNEYRGIDYTREQLVRLGIVAIGLVLALTIGIAAGIVPMDGEEFDRSQVWGVVLFGALGAAFSSALSLLEHGASRKKLPQVVLTGVITWMRPWIGAVAALAAFAFLRAGLLGIESAGAVYAVAFAAGFSERLVSRAAESVGSGSGR